MTADTISSYTFFLRTQNANARNYKTQTMPRAYSLDNVINTEEEPTKSRVL